MVLVATFDIWATSFWDRPSQPRAARSCSLLSIWNQSLCQDFPFRVLVPHWSILTNGRRTVPNRDDQTIPAAPEPHSGLVLTTRLGPHRVQKPNTWMCRASERIYCVRRAESLTSSVIAYAAPTTDIAQ